MTSNSSNGAVLPKPSLATAALHADHPDHVSDANYPVAPSISLSTTFRAPAPNSAHAKMLEEVMAGQAEFDMQDPSVHIYSRYSQSTNIRCEKVLSQVMNAHALTYSSGLAAAHAAVSYYAPSVIAIKRGYHGVHVSFQLYCRGRNVKFIDLDDDYQAAMGNSAISSESKADESSVVQRGGLMVWIETPLNPSGEARDLLKYVNKAKAVSGAHVVVDSTFAPPPLQDPFQQGADMVMHSGTKYFGGHSDLLCGVLAVKDKKEWNALWADRTFFGANLGSMEAYLLLRSLRTLTVRVQKQSQTATKLAAWLHSLSTSYSASVSDEDKPFASGTVIARAYHSSLQPRTDLDDVVTKGATPEDPTFDPSSQMPGGHAPTFAFRTTKPEYATFIPHLTTYFTPATSLGGVESLLEHRVKSDQTEDPRIIRVSIGLEEFEDLKADLQAAFNLVLERERQGQLQ